MRDLTLTRSAARRFYAQRNREYSMFYPASLCCGCGANLAPRTCVVAHCRGVSRFLAVPTTRILACHCLDFQELLPSPIPPPLLPLILVYLTGATLFLSLGVSRVFYILLDFIHTQEQLNALSSKTAKGSSAAGESEELRKRVRELEAQLKTSDAQGRDFDTLKKQASQQANEYNRLADEHIKAVSSSASPSASASANGHAMPGGMMGGWMSTVRRRRS